MMMITMMMLIIGGLQAIGLPDPTHSPLEKLIINYDDDDDDNGDDYDADVDNWGASE